MASNDLGGVWRTIGGRRVFIKDGDDLATAMKKSGKFGNKKNKDDETKKLLDLEMSKYTSKEKLERAKEKLENKNLPENERKYYENYIEKREGKPIKDIINEAKDKYKTAIHEGFGDYNKDYVPVYDNKIDYTGDFTGADLSTLNEEELTNAINVQSTLYKQTLNENLGDQRTRNGKMNKIFNTANQQKYENGTHKIYQEMRKRNMPKYNVYDKNDNLIVSSPTKEIADSQISDIQKTNEFMKKTYGWKETPTYQVKKENYSANRKSYNEYIKEHPNSKMQYSEFVGWFEKND